MQQKIRTIPTYEDSTSEALKVFKVSRTLNRKNAKRRLFARILAPNKDRAIELFMENIPLNEDNLYTLHSGDWNEEIISNK